MEAASGDSQEGAAGASTSIMKWQPRSGAGAASVAGLVFFGTSLVINTAAITAMMVSGLVRTDILHSNPHRTRENTINMLMLSPLLAVFAMLFWTFLSIVTAAALAAVTGARTGRVPFWAAAAMALPCGAVIQVQMLWINPYDSAVALSDLPFRLAGCAVTQLPALLGSWALLRRMLRRAAAAHLGNVESGRA